MQYLEKTQQNIRKIIFENDLSLRNVNENWEIYIILHYVLLCLFNENIDHALINKQFFH